ncbi:leucine--tRNA ligase [Ancylomarina euxinus]|uniref:Leucine--tRNA ligase n=1 Tax=Ancylomarina euxinus TaxID=2283627 RepID=A0A425Y116_9BACT|nr:leucine--tRNA ligase [Ancylomarina euxinus]MCZ4693768.1 leucine--tRNA ligase [Ancylomarina euxinus]MUP15152.1 leucine--tRNA ligase [Ancylomarina euxinus]RRG21575.1 leucine--tRNA ligase [Ancylomarina euxinus]
MEYNFKEIEKKWQKFWVDNKTYKVDVDTSKPKFYVLDMFPYPSGAGLHVGHPLGYIASDIYSRYKRLKGFNVLHPMGYDAYGLPAEQYAIQTGQHPAITTDVNIKRYRQQLDKIGFSYDWDREIRTSDPEYYKWTQWAFVEMFKHYFNNKTQKAEAISDLVLEFQTKGNAEVDASTSQEDIFTAEEWNALSEKEQDGILLNYRLAYLANTMVNWCPQLGTVLANDEIKEGLSVRGGHPVEQKKMRQWSLRVSAYAKRLLEDMEKLEWTDSLKEIQRNWIGRSEGAEMDFMVKDSDVKMTIFTTRPDTIFGVSFMVLAPESELVDQLTTPECKEKIAAYIAATKKRTERERMADVKTVSGEFTGSYAIHPFSGEAIPVWVSDYVLAGYGTGAIMAVPAHDSRDYAFAKHFDLPIVPVVSGGDLSEGSYDAKSGEMINSDFMNGLDVKDAIVKANTEIEERGLGKRKINFRLRDAIFSRQRYWGEPFPVYFKDGMPQMMDLDKLPLELPEVDKYLPTETGEPPLGRATNWTTEDGHPIELNTMPGFAGSSAYYLRYMDPRNNDALVSADVNEYWQDVDLYIGGTEHATGHLIYSRFWNKFLYDIGKVCKDEPFKKLINQGMIQGRSNFVYRIKNTNKYVSYGLREEYDTTQIHVDVNIVKNDVLDTEAFKKWMPEYADAEFVLEEGKYICGWAVEKMSKSMFNVVNPDVIVDEYGADTLRLYEMFLGPLEASKPWDTNGIDGVHKFLKKLWRLFHNEQNEFVISTDEPTKDEYKILHKSIKKIQEDIERFSFNTSVSAFMICVNELNTIKCNKKAILEELLALLAPFAPHITEELWKLCGHTNSITDAEFPVLNEAYLVEDVYSYPVSFNGKMRFILELSLSLTKDEIEEAVMNNEQAQKWIDGKTPKKVIIVPKKIVNIVV